VELELAPMCRFWLGGREIWLGRRYVTWFRPA
jgi:hypothetical protein